MDTTYYWIHNPDKLQQRCKKLSLLIRDLKMGNKKVLNTTALIQLYTFERDNVMAEIEFTKLQNDHV